MLKYARDCELPYNWIARNQLGIKSKVLVSLTEAITLTRRNTVCCILLKIGNSAMSRTELCGVARNYDSVPTPSRDGHYVSLSRRRSFTKKKERNEFPNEGDGTGSTVRSVMLMSHLSRGTATAGKKC